MNTAAARKRRRVGVIRRRSVQQIAVVWFCSVNVQRCLHYTVAEEGQHRPSRCATVQADLKSICYVATIRASCCQAADGALDVIWAASSSPVGVSCTPINGDRGVKGTFG